MNDDTRDNIEKWLEMEMSSIYWYLPEEERLRRIEEDDKLIDQIEKIIKETEIENKKKIRKKIKENTYIINKKHRFNVPRKRGTLSRHRHVWKLNYPNYILLRKYHIHHIDGVDWNNHISNLIRATQKFHHFLHKLMKDDMKEYKSLVNKIKLTYIRNLTRIIKESISKNRHPVENNDK